MAATRSVGRTASTIGMMEGAFFVSRTDLLQWVNNLLQVNLTKVEQCASGCVYCQIIDACHPSSVAMRKVNWMSKSDHEFIPNYKVLQMAFDKNAIERYIDVDKLIRAKYQDNLEMLQWMKCYWEREGSGRLDYDPLAAREGKALPTWAQRPGGAAGGGFEKENVVNVRPKAAPVKTVGAPEKRPGTAGRSPTSAAAPAKPAAATKPSSAPRSRDNSRDVLSTTAQQEVLDTLDANHKAHREDHNRLVQLESDKSKLDDENKELRATLDGLERERDYYFRKLRLVEMFCTQQQAQLDPNLSAEKVLSDITGILYAESGEDDDPDALANELNNLQQETTAGGD